MSTRCTGPQRGAASTCTGLSAPNVTVAVAVTARAVDRAGVGVDAAGQVDREHRHPGPLDRGDQRGAPVAQPAPPGDPDDAVEHQVGAR